MSDVVLPRPVISVPPSGGPAGSHLLAKPSGSTCNLDCTYCFLLSKEALYPNDASRMSEETLEAYIAQLLESHRTPEVTVAWQGGEPTLMGLDSFARSVELVEQYELPRRPQPPTSTRLTGHPDQTWLRPFAARWEGIAKGALAQT